MRLRCCAGQLYSLIVMIVVAMIASVRRTRCFKPSRILSWGRMPVSRTRLHSVHIISLPTWSTGEHWRLTPLDSLGVSTFGCSVAPVPFNSSLMHYFWNGWIETFIAFIIVAGSIFDIPLLANGPTTCVTLFHAALGSVTNKRFCGATVQLSQCRPHLQQCSSGNSLPDNDAGWDVWQSGYVEQLAVVVVWL
jgi:hypothetical protein